EVLQFQIRLVCDRVENDQPCTNALGQVFGDRVFFHAIQLQRVAGRPKQRRVCCVSSKIIDHRQQAAVEKLRVGSERIDALTGQNALANDPIRHYFNPRSRSILATVSADRHPCSALCANASSLRTSAGMASSLMHSVMAVSADSMRCDVRASESVRMDAVMDQAPSPAQPPASGTGLRTPLRASVA